MGLPFWTENIIKSELLKVVDTIGDFPTSQKLRNIGRFDLLKAIDRYGGFLKFRKLMDSELNCKPSNYWNDNTIKEEIQKVIDNIGDFPTREILKKINKNDLDSAIGKHGGYKKFRMLMGYPLKIKQWNENIIQNELKDVINSLGYFPTPANLFAIKKANLLGAINQRGGIRKFRMLMNYKQIRVPKHLRSDDSIKIEIQKIILSLGHFPSQNELNKIDKTLLGVIKHRFGLNNFRILLGYPLSLQEKYGRNIYCNVRGKNSEKIVIEILKDWCKIHNYPEPNYNKKLAKGNVIEIVCDVGKTIGIDVTNTKLSDGINVIRKWTTHDYHEHLDELWVVVFSDVFTEDNYKQWNSESPDNVKVFSIDSFLEELDYSVDEYTKNKIENYKSCTFHTKDKLKQKVI